MAVEFGTDSAFRGWVRVYGFFLNQYRCARAARVEIWTVARARAAQATGLCRLNKWFWVMVLG